MKTACHVFVASSNGAASRLCLKKKAERVFAVNHSKKAYIAHEDLRRFPPAVSFSAANSPAGWSSGILIICSSVNRPRINAYVLL